MSLNQGYQKDFILKKETNLAEAPGASGGRLLRRVTGQFVLRKEAVTSNEKTDSFQTKDERHGTVRVDGTLNQELLNGGSTELFEMLLMRDFAAVPAINAAADDGQISATGGVIARAAGSFAAAGLRRGMVIRFTGMGTNAANRNWLVTAMASDGLNFTVKPVDGGADLIDWVADSSGSIVIPGKRTFIPPSGHVLQSAYIEERNRVSDRSKVNLGLRVSALALSMGVNGMVTLAWTFIGIDQEKLESADSPYFTNPAPAGFGRAFSSAKGLLLVDGEVAAIATGFTLNLANGAATFPVVLANRSPDVPLGRALTATGQLTAGVVDDTYDDLFRSESEAPITLVLEAPALPGVAPQFMAFDLPRLKINSNDQDDPDGPVIQTVDFKALQHEGATGIDSTTIAVQDGSLV